MSYNNNNKSMLLTNKKSKKSINYSEYENKIVINFLKKQKTPITATAAAKKLVIELP